MTTPDYVQDTRERLLAAIGDALDQPATEPHQAEILAAIDKLIVVAGNDALVARAEAYVRVQQLIEAENGRINAVETKLRLAVEDYEAMKAKITACPTPAYHETHRYCPSCPWTEDWQAMEDEAVPTS